MKRFRFLASSMVLALCAVATSAQAAIISFTDRVSFDAAVAGFSGLMFEGWDGFAAGTLLTSAGGITYTSSTGTSVVTGAFLNSSGPHSLGRTPIEFFTAGDSITFTFDNPIKAFGIDINTFAVNDGAYALTTNLGDVSLSGFDPFPGFGTGQFAGFISDTHLTAVTVSAVATGEPYTLDSMRYVIPEPATLLLLSFGIAGVGLGRRALPQA